MRPILFAMFYPIVLASGMLADIVLSFQYDEPIPTMKEQCLGAAKYTREFVDGLAA